jgi:hypothetical protein
MTNLNTLERDLNTTTSKLHELERIAYGSSPSQSQSTSPRPSAVQYDKTKEQKLFALSSMLSGGPNISVHEDIDTRARRYAESVIEDAIRENEHEESLKMHGGSVSYSASDEERIDQSKVDKTYRLMSFHERR